MRPPFQVNTCRIIEDVLRPVPGHGTFSALSPNRAASSSPHLSPPGLWPRYSIMTAEFSHTPYFVHTERVVRSLQLDYNGHVPGILWKSVPAPVLQPHGSGINRA